MSNPPNFKSNQPPAAAAGKSFQVKEDAPTQVRVVKIDSQAEPAVGSFQYRDLGKAPNAGYATLRGSRGTNAPARGPSAEEAARKKKDSRFSLNPLVKSQLSVEEEEEAVIEQKVAMRVAALEKEARARAQEEGYQAGLKKGQQEAFDNFNQLGLKRIGQLDSCINALEAAKTEIFGANERFIVELIYRMTKMVILKELSADKEYILRLAKDLVDRSGARENIRIRISPNEMETLEMLKSTLQQKFGELKNLQVEISSEIETGGCHFETDWSSIDATLATQLMSLYEALVAK